MAYKSSLSRDSSSATGESVEGQSVVTSQLFDMLQQIYKDLEFVLANGLEEYVVANADYFQEFKDKFESNRGFSRDVYIELSQIFPEGKADRITRLIMNYEPS